MTNEHQLIKGDLFTDDRGSLSCINEFSLKPIVRFYEITPKNTSIIRAWQAHKNECKWFYCTQGSFKVNVIKLDSFENPSEDLTVHTYELNSEQPQVLFIPGGYANGFKASSEGSKLMVFSDFELEASKRDDFRFETNKWINKW
ncbi:dTDP-4-dehydrorhamnose 3,5-epimerase [Formosa sp. Hel1_31_208]|uniref:WxcM-like domain-containing protein n=1 Tax=Formosa sp. Hel1_31_208 TaxID=1798225 RepID=UPI00087D6754|nr:WxcM-like domain-containing protein [Formosa sp. Hel1_31_208]SDS37790.1 dTDP-4-dehydrorhamnose 3,5-epimerase [Formosa sp. Hel1_31_208]